MTLISLDARQAMTAETTDVVPITLLTFTHPGLEDPVLLSSDRTKRLSVDPLYYGTVSRTNTFLWMPMSVLMPGDDEQSAPEIKIIIDAVDRQIFSVIRASIVPAQCHLELIYDTDLDEVIQSLDAFEVVSAPYDESQVTLVLSQESFWGEGWPFGRMTPAAFPGIHR